MQTNRDVVSLFKTKIKEISGDRYISDRAALADLKSVANLLIKREVDRRKLRDVDSIYTTIPCLELKSVPIAECCSYRSECNIRRSKHKLPRIGESIWGYIIEGVWSVDGTTQFDRGTAQKYTNLKDLSNKNPKLYWIQNDYLYVSDEDIELVKMRLYLEDTEVNPKLFECSEDSSDYSCENPLDAAFKAPGYLIQSILDVTTKNYIGTTARIPTDATDDDVKQQ